VPEASAKTAMEMSYVERQRMLKLVGVTLTGATLETIAALAAQSPANQNQAAKNRDGRCFPNIGLPD
jgi:hypothetical protein